MMPAPTAEPAKPMISKPDILQPIVLTQRDRNVKTGLKIKWLAWAYLPLTDSKHQQPILSATVNCTRAHNTQSNIVLFLWMSRRGKSEHSTNNMKFFRIVATSLLYTAVLYYIAKIESF
jgi:hypothetical protein